MADGWISKNPERNQEEKGKSLSRNKEFAQVASERTTIVFSWRCHIHIHEIEQGQCLIKYSFSQGCFAIIGKKIASIAMVKRWYRVYSRDDKTHYLNAWTRFTILRTLL